MFKRSKPVLSSKLSAKNSFTTQAALLKKFGQENDLGIASPLANLFLISEIQNQPPDYLNSARETYDKAVDLENEMLKEYEQGNRDGLEHMGFFKTNCPHQDKMVSKETLTNVDKFKEEFKDTSHALICYPTDHELYFSEKEITAMKNGDIPKQETKTTIYYGQNSQTNECSFFDPDLSDGVRKGNCDQIRNQLVTLIASRYRKNDSQAYVGKSETIPKPSIRKL